MFIANETLYQLSYTPEIFGQSPFNLQNFGCNSTAAHPFCPPDEFRESISVREIAFDQIRRFTKVSALDLMRGERCAAVGPVLRGKRYPKQFLNKLVA